jgi:HAD superfamily hydrolase (TIGR01509 family)
MSTSSARPAGVIFDLDGTLVDTGYLHTVSWWQAFEQFGYTVPMARIHRAVGMGGDNLIEHVLPEPCTHAEEITKAHDVLFATWHATVRPLPGAEALLRWCRDERLTVALASSSGQRDLDAMLDVLGHPDFDVLTTGDDAEHSKPSPDIVETALHRAGLSPDEAVMVGDSVWDVQAAAKAGVPCVGLTCGGTSGEELTAAGAVETFADPAALLDSWRDR